MKVGDLVRMTDEPHKIIGVIVKIVDDTHKNNRVYYKVNWMDDWCDSSYMDADMLEVISESR